MDPDIKNQNKSFLREQLLMAMPGLVDPNFSRTVACICEHTSAGTVGIVVNRIHPVLSGKDIFDELKIKCTSGVDSVPIHLGGPVNMADIFVLHGPPLNWESSLLITQSLAMSNTRDILEAIAIGKGPEAFIIALGCAGWGPGQIEYEIKANVWLTSPMVEKIIFDIPIERRWKEAVKKMGIDPVLLSDVSGHA